MIIFGLDSALQLMLVTLNVLALLETHIMIIWPFSFSVFLQGQGSCRGASTLMDNPQHTVNAVFMPSQNWDFFIPAMNGTAHSNSI